MRADARPVELTAPEAQRVAALFPSFRDFVDTALFDPGCGYYSTGQVRFGYGGHYDTFPLALAPLFGRMVAQYGFRFWRRAGEPEHFEICELGAGNGQLCLDVLVTVAERARQEAPWSRFTRALRYHIIERSPALIARQQQQLGPLARRVRWTNRDLAQGAPRRSPLGACGVVVANEVLDCLSHHQIVPRHDRTPGVIFVIPTLRPPAEVPPGVERVPGLRPGQWAVPAAHLPAVLADESLRGRLRFSEVALPLEVVPGLEDFLRRHYPEFFSDQKFLPYFACPAIERLVAAVARLYDYGEILWIDYGDRRDFHLRTSPSRRVFAGPPRSGVSVYRAPGTDDITFLVDFSVVEEAAQRAGLQVKFYGPQGELARRSGVALDAGAVDLIVRYRALGWMLAVVGVDPERDWRHTGLTWGKRRGSRMRLRDDAKRAVHEFLGQRRSNFKLMILAT
jgi:SAM-dependent MidA family methyltransferase